MKRNIQAYLELSLAMALAGSSVVAGKLLISAFPVFLGGCLRFVAASLILVPWLLSSEKGFPRVNLKIWFYLFLQSLSGVFLFTVFMLVGLKYTTAIESGIITSTTPAVLGIISFVFLKEQLNGRKIAGIVLSLAGILVINIASVNPNINRGPNPLLGNLLIFSAVVGEALFTIFRKITSPVVSNLAGTTILSVIALVMFIPFASIEAISFNWAQTPLQGWLVILYYGGFATIVAFICWFRGLAKVPASTAAVFTGMMPLSAVILSCLVLRESFSLYHLLGIILVLVGIGFAAIDHNTTRS
ncbi:MAG: DMT family transporter [Chloroflexi bacterium]|nr:DMT family transporter [Chloroflexota bacterium]